MDIGQQLFIGLQALTLLIVVALLISSRARVSRLEQRLGELGNAHQQHTEDTREALETVVSEIKDHFEINLANLQRDSDEIRQHLHVNGEQSQRALELQELAFSEATTGNTRIQDVLSENHRRQQKLIESLTRDSVTAFRETTTQVRDSIKESLDQQDVALHKMSESSQRMLANMGAHFNQLDNETGVIKKAIAAVINGQRQAEQALPEHLQTACGTMESRQQQLAGVLQQALNVAHKNHTMLEDSALSLADVQRSLQSQRMQIGDVSDNTGTTLQLVERIEKQQLDLDTFQRRHESLSQELAELSVVMQPLLEAIDERQLGGGSEDEGSASVESALDDLKATTMEMSDEWQKALQQLSDVFKHRHGDMTDHLNQVQANISSELDSLRFNQRQVADELHEMQRALKSPQE